MPYVTRHSLVSMVILLVVAAMLSLGFLWSGLYDVGADDAHLPPVHAALETLRDRSIAVRARDIVVPNLADPSLIRQGAGNYEAMCSGCHLAPGKSATELSRGLYPAPPAFFAGVPATAARQFWVIQHGIKASAMPAWGKSMDTPAIWGLVALLQKLPTLDAAQYQALVESSAGHSHGPGTRAGMETEEAHAHSHSHASESDHDKSAAATSADAKPAAAVVDRFSAALAHGDLATAQSLLDPQVLILESGGAEQSRDEYMAQHAGADVAFLRDAQVHPGRRRAQALGDLAWVGSESEIHLSEKGRPVTVRSTETMVLLRHHGAWRIVHIHWSSRPKR